MSELQRNSEITHTRMGNNYLTVGLFIGGDIAAMQNMSSQGSELELMRC
jgi:hypothetical protein